MPPADSLDVAPTPVRPSPVTRVLALVAGTLAALAIILSTVGLALLGFAGLGITIALARSRGRFLTRGRAWLGAAAGVAIPVAVVLVIVLALGEEVIVESVREGTQQQDSVPPSSVERAIERLSPRTPASDAMERQMEQWTTNETFIWVTILLTLGMSASMLGVFVGTVVWGAALLLGYGATGRWLGSRPPPTADW